MYSLSATEKVDRTHVVVISESLSGAEPTKPISVSTTGLKTFASVRVRGRLQPSNMRPMTVMSMDAHGNTIVARQAEGSTRESYTVFESVPDSVLAKHRHVLDVGLSVSNVSGNFFRSKIVSLTPRLVLVNKSGFTMEYSQVL